jgi:hypothetical protein
MYPEGDSLDGGTLVRVSEEAVDVWLMPFKSQEFERGPELIQRRGDATLRLDYETESGLYEWMVVYFTGVQAIRFTAWRYCSPDQIDAYDRLQEVNASEWIRAAPDLPGGIKHFRIFFDEVGCYELLAAGFAAGRKGSGETR